MIAIVKLCKQFIFVYFVLIIQFHLLIYLYILFEVFDVSNYECY